MMIDTNCLCFCLKGVPGEQGELGRSGSSGEQGPPGLKGQKGENKELTKARKQLHYTIKYLGLQLQACCNKGLLNRNQIKVCVIISIIFI